MIRFYGEVELVIALMDGSDNYHYFLIDIAGFRRCSSRLPGISQGIYSEDSEKNQRNRFRLCDFQHSALRSRICCFRRRSRLHRQSN